MAKEINYINLAQYSDDQLKMMRDDALLKHDEIIEDWAKELGSIMNEKGFDQYSRKGERRLNKLNKKYADPLSDAQVVLISIQEELDKRDNYYEQQRYMQGGKRYIENIDDDEFLKREMEKTARIRAMLDDSDEDNY